MSEDAAVDSEDTAVDKVAKVEATEMQPAVLLRIEEGIARIVFDRPDQGNKIGDDFFSGFDDATLKCSERDDIRALVISATGKWFSVGGDISAMVARRDELPTKDSPLERIAARQSREAATYARPCVANC